MKIRCVAAATLLGLLAFNQQARAQAAGNEVDLASATAAAQGQYMGALGVHPQLLNGPEYLDYALRYHARIGHQFFFSPDKQVGSVNYNDHLFSNVRLAYDLVLDQVVLSPQGTPLSLRLIDERLPYFSIGTHRFVRVVADSASGKVMRTGYHELLLDNAVQVLAKRSKRLQEHVAQQSIDVEFTERDKLFLHKAGQYYAVSSKGSVLRVLADRSKEMQQYLQEHKLPFSKAQREASTVQLVAYYCSLPPR